MGIEMSWTLKKQYKDLMKQSRFLENKQDRKCIGQKIKREGGYDQSK